jgi:hypothetical protein
MIIQSGCRGPVALVEAITIITTVIIVITVITVITVMIYYRRLHMPLRVLQ